jgi:hypothetical protein
VREKLRKKPLSPEDIDLSARLSARETAPDVFSLDQRLELF